MMHDQLIRDKTGLLLIDVQERLFPHIHKGDEVVNMMEKVIRGFQLLSLPMFATEQYPQGLGGTIPQLASCLGPQQAIWPKTTFSCVADETIRKRLLDSTVRQWVLVGFEAHVCVLETAKALVRAGRQVVVVSDATSSRSPHNYAIALEEMREAGVRVSCAETVLFELMGDSKNPDFKVVSALFR